MKRIIKSFMMAAILTLLFSMNCQAAVKKVTITSPTKSKAYTVYRTDKNVSKKLKATVTTSKKNDKKTVTYKSSNSKVVSVSSKGVMTCRMAGTATITVASKQTPSRKDTLKVKVVQRVTKLTATTTTGYAIASGKSITMTQGKSVTVRVAALPATASDKVKWTTSNSKVAKVSSKGIVTAVKKGTAKITATATDGSKEKLTFSVKVVTGKVTRITVDKKSVELKVGKTTTVKATVSTSGSGANKTLVWASSNTKVATVDKNGKIKAIKKGSATITVKSIDGTNKYAKIAVKVVTAIEPPTEPTEAPTETPTQKPTETPTQKPTETPTEKPTETPTQKPTETPTEKPTETPTETPTEKPTETPTQKPTETPTEKPTETPTETPTEKPTEPATVAVSEINLSETEKEMIVGDTYTISATVKPENATDKTLVYSSSDEDVASVSTSGVVTAKAKGLAAITVSTADGKVKATCGITVIKEVVMTTDTENTYTLDNNCDQYKIVSDKEEVVITSGMLDMANEHIMGTFAGWKAKNSYTEKTGNITVAMTTDSNNAAIKNFNITGLNTAKYNGNYKVAVTEAVTEQKYLVSVTRPDGTIQNADVTLLDNKVVEVQSVRNGVEYVAVIDRNNKSAKFYILNEGRRELKAEFSKTSTSYIFKFNSDKLLNKIKDNKIKVFEY